MSDYDKNLDKAAKVLGANVIKMVSLILHKHDAAIIEASMEAIEEARAEEREACAKVCLDVMNNWKKSEDNSEYTRPDGLDCADAIRARGQG